MAFRPWGALPSFTFPDLRLRVSCSGFACLSVRSGGFLAAWMSVRPRCWTSDVPSALGVCRCVGPVRALGAWSIYFWAGSDRGYVQVRASMQVHQGLCKSLGIRAIPFSL